MPVDVRLIAIADPGVAGGRDLVEAARRAEAGGATLVQLRMKHASAGEMFQMARRLLEVLAIPVYVNDRADVALAAGAHGVHLGAEDAPAGVVRRLAPPLFGIGVSVGNPAEAEPVRGVTVDYWSIGSVFRTPTKADAGEPIGLDGFSRLARLAPEGTPVVAIGGLDASNAAEVVRAGARGLAAISAIFGADDVESATRRIRQAVDEALRETVRDGESR